MILQAIFFYLFAGVCVASAIMVIAAKNPVHSVLFLILAFVNAPGLCLAECRAIGRDILLHRIVDVAERAHPVLHHRPNEKARKPIVGNIGSAREQERTN